jgi:hypothetical protein
MGEVNGGKNRLKVKMPGCDNFRILLKNFYPITPQARGRLIRLLPSFSHSSYFNAPDFPLALISAAIITGRQPLCVRPLQ